MTRHSWAGWYLVPTKELAVALAEARRLAHQDHTDTPIESMMTPEIRRVGSGVRVKVIGRPA